MKVALVFSAILMTQLVSQNQGLVVTTDGTDMTVDCENVITTISSSDTNQGRNANDTPITSLTFTNCDNVNTEIGETAFVYATLNTLTLPNQVTIIGVNAFRNAQLTSLTLPDSVESIEGAAFYNSPLTSLTIPSSVRFTIGNSAFGYQGSGSIPTLTTLVLETSIPTDNVFRYHTALTSVTFGAAVTEISQLAFRNAPLVSLTIPASVTTIGSSAFGYQGSGSISTLTNLVLETSAPTNQVFMYHTALTSVTFGAAVTEISSSAFRNAPLVSLTIPSSVTSFGTYAFGYQGSGSIPTLTTLVLETSASTGEVFRYHTALTSVTFAEGTTEISNYAFNNAPLVSLTIPASVTSIGSGAFNAARLTLTTLVLESTATIGTTFLEAPLTSLTLPDGMTSIGNYAFKNSFLTQLTLPSSVTSIGIEAFKGSIIHTLYVPASLTTVTNNTALRFGPNQNYEWYNNPATCSPPYICRYSFLGSDAIPCMYAVYEPRTNWTGTPYLCRKQINMGGSSPCNSHACPSGTSVRYDVEECADDNSCTDLECCGISLDSTPVGLYSSDEITQLKTRVSNLMSENPLGACVFD